MLFCEPKIDSPSYITHTGTTPYNPHSTKWTEKTNSCSLVKLVLQHNDNVHIRTTEYTHSYTILTVKKKIIKNENTMSRPILPCQTIKRIDLSSKKKVVFIGCMNFYCWQFLSVFVCFKYILCYFHISWKISSQFP